MSAPRPSRGQAVRTLIELALFVGVVAADAAGFVPISQTLFLIPLIAVLLRLRGDRWSAIGFRRPERLGRAIVIGVVAGIAMELLAVCVTTPWIHGMLGAEPDVSGLAGIRGSVAMLLLFLALNWTLAAFGEELAFRGFLMHRLARLFGDSRAAWALGLVLSSVLFGWGHTEQGAAGWIQEGLSGFLLGMLFLANGRNLAVPIVAHGISNSLAFVLIYLGRYPGLG